MRTTILQSKIFKEMDNRARKSGYYEGTTSFTEGNILTIPLQKSKMVSEYHTLRFKYVMATDKIVFPDNINASIIANGETILQTVKYYCSDDKRALFINGLLTLVKCKGDKKYHIYKVQLGLPVKV